MSKAKVTLVTQVAGVDVSDLSESFLESWLGVVRAYLKEFDSEPSVHGPGVVSCSWSLEKSELSELAAKVLRMTMNLCGSIHALEVEAGLAEEQLGRPYCLLDLAEADTCTEEKVLTNADDSSAIAHRLGYEISVTKPLVAILENEFCFKNMGLVNVASSKEQVHLYALDLERSRA